MGIYTFASAWVLKKYRNTLVVRNGLPGEVSSLVIDMNGTIHRALAKIYHYGDYDNEHKRMDALSHSWNDMKIKIFDQVMLEIDEIMAKIIPEDMLVVAIDGPTCLAKMWQQRTRRYRSEFYSSDDSFDSSIVTPGTEFMIELDGHLQREFVEKRASFPSRLIYSSHLSPGEGEHKLMEMYRKGVVIGDKDHVIYGLDADLILLSLLSPQENLVLVREDRRELLDIDLFRKELINEAPNQLKDNAIIDFIILMTLVGNDFIPHGPLHHSMYELVEGLLAAYYENGVPLSVQNGDIFTINLPEVAKIVRKMHVIQAERLVYEVEYPDMYQNEEPAPNRFTFGALKKDKEGNTVFDFEAFRSIWYTNAFGCNNGGNSFNDDFTEDDITDMCESYVEGMLWCTRYYQTKDVSQRWVYRYYHAPLFTDLADYLERTNLNFGIQLDNWLASSNTTIDWNALVQLACVAPLESKAFPSELYKLPKVIPDMFPEAVVFESDGFSEIRNYNVIMPMINLDRVMSAIKSLRLTNFVKWNMVDDLILDSTEEQIAVYYSWVLNQSYTRKFDEEQRENNRKRRQLLGLNQRGRGRGRGRVHNPGPGERVITAGSNNIKRVGSRTYRSKFY